MSHFDILRKRGFWVALAVSAAVLLILWSLGALLIVKGTVSQDVMSGWICGSFFLAGLTGGVLAAKGRSGGMTAALTMAACIIILSILAAWILYGGVSLAGDGWKNMVCTVLGGGSAGLLAARKGKAHSRKRAVKRR